MGVTLSVISTRREHLFRIAELLVLGLKNAIPAAPESSITISVNGTFDGGKKIFPDAARNYMFKTNMGTFEATGHEIACAPLPDHITFQGMPEFNEHWSGLCDGKMMEVSFLNADWASGSYHDCDDSINFMDKKERAAAFPKCRSYPGLTFVHNARDFARNSDIAIRLEGVGSQQHNSYIDNKSPALRDTFNHALQSCAEWVRYIEITINNENLLQDTRFLKALNTIVERQLDTALWSYNPQESLPNIPIHRHDENFTVPVLNAQSYKLKV